MAADVWLGSKSKRGGDEMTLAEFEEHCEGRVCFLQTDGSYPPKVVVYVDGKQFALKVDWEQFYDRPC